MGRFHKIYAAQFLIGEDWTNSKTSTTTAAWAVVGWQDSVGTLSSSATRTVGGHMLFQLNLAATGDAITSARTLTFDLPESKNAFLFT